MGKSKPEPVFFTDAGARFTTTCSFGAENPAALSAERTRIRASCTDVSPIPTMCMPGRPAPTSISTDTGTVSTPWIAHVFTHARDVLQTGIVHTGVKEVPMMAQHGPIALRHADSYRVEAHGKIVFPFGIRDIGHRNALIACPLFSCDGFFGNPSCDSPSRFDLDEREVAIFIPCDNVCLAPATPPVALDDFERTYDMLAASGLDDRIVIDFSVMSSFDYYTGFVFEAYAPGLGTPLGSGGRYDNMLGTYGMGRPAAGFAFYLEEVQAALAASDEDERENADTPLRVAVPKGSLNADTIEALAAMPSCHVEVTTLVVPEYQGAILWPLPVR